MGARHHVPRGIVRGRDTRHAHEGHTLSRDRRVSGRLLLRLDTLGARRARGRHHDPLDTWTVELAARRLTELNDAAA